MSIVAKIGSTPQTLNDWGKKAEVDSGRRVDIPTEMAERIKELEHENRKLRQANEILCKALAYFVMAPSHDLHPNRYWAAGARPPVEVMVSFIDAYRDADGALPSRRHRSEADRQG